MKRLIAIFLSLATPSWSAVAWNSNSTSATDSGSAAASPQTNTKMTVGVGSNRALVCLISFDKTFATPGTITVNWDSAGTNQPMTLLTSNTNTTNTCSVALYGLLNPTSGNKTFRVAWTVGTAEMITWCSDFTGVEPSSIVNAFIHATTSNGTSTTPSITITSAVGNLTLDGGNESTTNPPGSPSKTLIFSFIGAGASNPWSSRAAGAASNTHSWTLTSAAWTEVGIDLAAAAAATGGISSKMKKLESLGQL